jgi:hypothetical protein
MSISIDGIVKRGNQTSRVLYLQDGVRRSGRIPNRFLEEKAFPQEVVRAFRTATARDERHELVCVRLGTVIRSRSSHSRCTATTVLGNGTVIVDTPDAIPGRYVKVERSRLRP